jgi:hypothetical protein
MSEVADLVGDSRRSSWASSLTSPATRAASRWSPGVSTLDEDGCGWICLSRGCPEPAAGELEAQDLVEARVSEALAGRLALLVGCSLQNSYERVSASFAPSVHLASASSLWRRCRAPRRLTT